MCILSGKRPSVTVFPFSENGHSLCSLKEWEVKKVKKGEIMPSNPHCCSWSSLWLWAGCDNSHCQIKIDNIIYESYETWRVKEKDCNTWSVRLYKLSPKLEMLLALENQMGFWKNQVDKKTEKESLVDCDWFLSFHTLNLMRFLFLLFRFPGRVRVFINQLTTELKAATCSTLSFCYREGFPKTIALIFLHVYA